MRRRTQRWMGFASQRRLAADERGVALVEFALVLPLILLLLFGMIDMGKAFNYWNDETHLANEAARYAVVNTNPFTGTSSLEDAIKGQADSAELRDGCGSCSISNGGITVSFCFVNGTSATHAGDPLRATVTATYNWMAYLIGQGLPVHSGLVGSATMRLEKDYNTTTPSQNAYLNGMSSSGQPAGPVAC